MKDKIKNSILPLISLIVIAILFFLVTSLSPMVGVDNHVATYNIDNSKINLFYLLSRAFERCLSWNARVGEFFYFFLAPLPHIVHDIFNTLFFVIFILLILKYAFDYKDSKEDGIKNCWWLSLVIAAIIFHIEPSLWHDFFWMADSCNHLWGLCILMLTFLPFRKFFFESYKISGAKLVLYCMASFIAGTVSENIVPFIVGTIILIIGYKFIKEKKIYLWSILSLISFILGYIWLMFNPSTWTRYDFFDELDWSLGTKGKMFIEFFGDFKYYFLIVGILLLIYIIKLLIISRIKKESIQIKDSLVFNIILYVLSFVSFAMLFFSPYYTTRALLIISFTSIMMIVYLLNELISFNNNIPKIILAGSSFLIIIFYSFYIRGIYKDYNNYEIITKDFIKEQLSYDDIGKLIVPLYDKFPDSRLISLVERELCTNNIVKEKYNVSDDIEIICLYNYGIR